MINVASPTTAMSKKRRVLFRSSKTPPTVALLSTRLHVHSRGSATLKSNNRRSISERRVPQITPFDAKETVSLVNSSGTVFDPGFRHIVQALADTSCLRSEERRE